ncbi:cytochrome-c oxidase, cbb3-type subunit III [Croceicoccus sp. BE223]|uniref:cytochrome-c oxidase, cbb3-type subunit III n=1 Tax=Croceicoccus sp. BE223 TaxID=2817716 RepID=UPI00285607F0|nr:cytochrome-c oxidase, cbb3-type subunit III [Croceicoccus sp. BE223]MDR7101025.1 cytochrome c oxidase cbb3-type subunit 3 [Croceicoccus sp. BE223]
MANKRVDQPTGTETVGHEWDGIEELNTPLPRWWLWTFYLTIAWAIGYVVLYPAIPLLEKGTEGVLGWTSRGQLAQEMSLADQARRSVGEALAATDITKLEGNPQLMQQAVAGGRAAFRVHCSQCHGSGAAGSQSLGYPNLNDDDWLWGGDLKAIETTLVHGIRQDGDDATRQSVMPSFNGALDAAQQSALADHVLALGGKGRANPAGAQIFADNCAACHGATGEGSRELGAPRLNDAIWLYGGTKADIVRQVLNPRMGVMPAWQHKLDPVKITMLAAYVHSLGGGEPTVPEPSLPDPAASAAASDATD